MKKRIETESLLLRPLAGEDAEAVLEWVSDPEVNRYMPYPRYTELEAVKKWIASIKPEHPSRSTPGRSRESFSPQDRQHIHGGRYQPHRV